MSYENAPATVLLATNCVMCARPLVDAQSIEAGMGPDCRDMYGAPETLAPETRENVNARVHALAAGKLTAAEIAAELVMIRALGCERMADKLESRLVDVSIETVDARTIAVVTPYSPAFTDDLKASINGRRWDKEGKRWLVSVAMKNDLWKVIRRHFAGGVGRGPSGLFPITAGGAR